jgi:hypothetical protein
VARRLLLAAVDRHLGHDFALLTTGVAGRAGVADFSSSFVTFVASIGRNRGGGVGGVSLGPRLTKGGGGGGSPISGRTGRGRGSLFLRWEKEFFEESSVERSILTTFVATKDKKKPS